MRMAGRLKRPRRFCYGNIISRLHVCAIRIFGCVLIVLRCHCAGASIGASQKEYSVTLLGTGLLAVSFSKRKRNGQTANSADISFRNIPIPENANGTCMQLNADISIAETARAHQIAARVFFFPRFSFSIAGKLISRGTLRVFFFRVIFYI